VRAYLAIYAETHAELDLFVARKTATEEGIDRGKGIDPEEATLANMDIYSVTHDPEDMAEVCKYLMMVVDLGRRAALVSVFDHLD
jgi:hypothetical protein